jgi:hypothetical protein
VVTSHGLWSCTSASHTTRYAEPIPKGQQFTMCSPFVARSVTVRISDAWHACASFIPRFREVADQRREPLEPPTYPRRTK